MKIGIDTFSFHIALAAGGYDIFRTLDWLDDQGFAGLQININGPEDKFLGADHSNTDHLKRVRSAIEQKGFFVEIGGRRTSPEMLRWQLQLCADIGADTLRTLVVLQDNLESTFAQTTRDMEAILPFAESLNVKIALENHEDITAAELRQFLDTIPHSHLGACVDTGNDLIVYGDPLEAAQQLAPRAVTTHIKDHKLVRVGDTVQSVGVPLGTGDIDLPAIMKVITVDSPLNRILLQDTTGYSSRLNKFDRPDIRPTSDYADIPCYPDEPSLRADNRYMQLDQLSPDELRKLATQQTKNIHQDLLYLRKLIPGVT
jgi:sugar phosphate isomerase/epimerase